MNLSLDYIFNALRGRRKIAKAISDRSPGAAKIKTDVPVCPYCGSEEGEQFRWTKGVGWYQCMACGMDYLF
jgi:DNA-directed RNA polymerase subunit RPC12/RpoP